MNLQIKFVRDTYHYTAMYASIYAGNHWKRVISYKEPSFILY